MFVDGFVIPVPEDRLDDYRKVAEIGRDLWMEYGALAYMEAVAEDVPEGQTTDFYRAIKREPGETVVFPYILYRSREHRDTVIAKVMADPRLPKDMAAMPFDGKRMIFGGFRGIVGAGPIEAGDTR